VVSATPGQPPKRPGDSVRDGAGRRAGAGGRLQLGRVVGRVRRGLVTACFGRAHRVGRFPGHSSPAASTGHSAPATSDTLTPAHREALADRYLAIAVPANHRLDHEVEGFADHERSDLAAAEADLRAEAATERGFDRRLAAIPFPPGIAAMARALIQANQSRAALTGRQARSASLARLHSFAAQRRAADAAVEFGARLIRRALALPPPSES
jgi:hypothetical protein